MEQKKILEGNKLIADFMGCKEYGGAGAYSVDHLPNYWNKQWIFENLQYHSSWDWLMPVVGKAKDFLNNMDRPSKHHCCNGDRIEVDVQCYLWSTDISGTWKSLVEWVKWYNSLTPKPIEP